MIAVLNNNMIFINIIWPNTHHILNSQKGKREKVRPFEIEYLITAKLLHKRNENEISKKVEF